ncbi:beta-ketoacyl-ACP synthase 3 [Tautonia marina]|uniref:beta-ketoacyl-ACP synthase 3 n=1 Tax=Tautonia marina TaxID=2653855 RepID=UPI0012604EA4|nr:beta-ketoacyl-ACP synthase 3 [Tautonia marina]
MNQQDQSRGVPPVVHRRFTQRIPAISGTNWVSVYRAMVTARRVDEAETDLTARGLAFFSCPCTGHESLAVLAPLLTSDDYLHLHYRDKALILGRGVPASTLLHNVIASGASPSAGRQMTPFLGDPGLHLLCQNVPVGNHALQSVGVAAAVKDRAGRPIVVCSMGDGASQQGEVLEAIAEAVRRSLPVMFLIEDNGLSISTRTEGRTFFSLPDCYADPEVFYGLPIHRINGRDPVELSMKLDPIVETMRSDGLPTLAVISLDRLSSHTNADDDRVYRTEDERDRAKRLGDPLAILRQRMIESDVPPDVLDRIDAEVDREIRDAVDEALQAADPTPSFVAKAELPPRLTDPASEYRGGADGPRLTMIEAMREVLRHRLETDPRVTLCGQDIEDPKGDVFGVTRGLSTAFPGRVINAALAESTIVGNAIGRAMVGERPVAFLQFADFLPVAFNQIHSELGSLWWRSAGTFSCPVILMVACGGYRPGLGPFHAQTMEALAAHVPGVDVVMPSSAGDAAGLLNAAFESDRPTIVFYPKIGLNDRDRTTSADVTAQRVPLGRARFCRTGDALTLVTWGATVPLAEKVADTFLDQTGFSSDVIDLRSLSPWDRDAVRASARRTRRVIVIHEDNQTCGFGAEVVADVAEHAGTAVQFKRVTRPDTYIPCNFSAQLDVLPSYRRTLEAAAEVLGLELCWESGETRSNTTVIEARGPSPADEAITVLSWKVKNGDVVSSGTVIAELVADKAVFDFVAPSRGRILKLHASEGERLRVGAPLLELEPLDRQTQAATRRLTREEHGRPILRQSRQPSPKRTREKHSDTSLRVVLPTVEVGSRIVTNEELLERFPGRSTDDIQKRTGISSRHRLAEGETVLTLAVSAAQRALDSAGISASNLDLLICCTGTPGVMTPSLACRVLHGLGASSGTSPELPAFDLSAACSGYLYGLATAYDFTRSHPDGRVLLVTAEALSPLADENDFDTSILFGDAATATLIGGPEAKLPEGSILGRLHRPVLSARGEPGTILRVPSLGNGHIAMDGLKVYAEAVRRMITLLEACCAREGLTVGDLDLLVPHQANARIIQDIRMRLKLPTDRVLIELGTFGNTSSSSIPLAIATAQDRARAARTIGLTAFGGGFTFGAALIRSGE